MTWLLLLGNLVEMAMESKTVSKRSGHVFPEEDDGYTSKDPQAIGGLRHGDLGLDYRETTSSSSTTSSSRSSLDIPVEEIVGSSRSSQCSANDAARQPLLVAETYYGADGAELELRDLLSPHADGTQPESGVLIQSEKGPLTHPSGRSDSIPHIGLKHNHHLNFGTVVPGVYRSSYPRARDYTFIHGLGLKTIVTLVEKDFHEGYKTFILENGIKHIVFNMRGTKKEEIPIRTMKSILSLVLDQQNHPLLIHCNHGKHRTGCVVAVVRKLSGWELPSIIEEYKSYAEPKIRECDIKYITDFEPAKVSSFLVRESSLRFRVRNYLRVSIFACFVLIVWLVSGTKMASTQKRYRHAKD